MPMKNMYDPITSPARQKYTPPPKAPKVPCNPPQSKGIPSKYSGMSGQAGTTQMPRV